VLCIDESEAVPSIRSVLTGSSGGPDGLRPQHLLDLVNNIAEGSELLNALTAFVDELLEGSCHSDMVSVMFGGRLLALNKKSGRI
jgi:hypothetical protein